MIPVAKAVLKRGALVTAANWETILVQFVAEASIRALLAVPLAGAAFLLALLVGDDLGTVLDRSLRETLALLLTVLAQHRGALVAFLAGVAVVMAGGSLLTSIVKSGITAVLVRAECRAPAVERPPLRWVVVREARDFTLARYLEGVGRYGARFIRLGLVLIIVYASVLAAYISALIGGYSALVGGGHGLLATTYAAAASVLLVTAVSVVNLFYLLSQIAVVAHDRHVAGGIVSAFALAGRRWREVGAVFLVILMLAVLATAASILATGLLGFVGFVPIVGVAVLPLQLLAWLGRGLLFQFLGLSALGAYARIARGLGAAATAGAMEARSLASGVASGHTA